MDGEPVAKLSIAPRPRDDARIAAHLDTFARRVEATPPGMCPLAVQLTMLQASGAQTCGKCVPCRDGIPQLAAMLRPSSRVILPRKVSPRSRSANSVRKVSSSISSSGK